MASPTCSRGLSSLFSTLSVHEAAPRSSRLGQIRTQATSRRTTKRLRPEPSTLAPAPHPDAATHHYAGRAIAATSNTTRLTFDPPSTAPNVYHTPPIFLPPSDPRRKLLGPTSHATASPYSADASRDLGPAVRQTYEKKYHLTAEQIAEMRRLRLEDPNTWTRKALAAKYGCTEFFVGFAAPSPVERREWHRSNLEAQKEKWGPRRRAAREDRQKRRELWARDA